MKALLLIVTITLSAFQAQALDWPKYTPLGACTFTSEDNTASMHFYSEELEASEAVSGFVLIKVTTEGKTEELGAVDATYTMSADSKQVVLNAGGELITIPFGEGVELKDPSSDEVIHCSLQY